MNPRALEAAQQLADLAWPLKRMPWDDVNDAKRRMTQRFAEIINAAMVEAILDEVRTTPVRQARAEQKHIDGAIRLRKACETALAHVRELRDAWERGCINEIDGLGGTRSNRNIEVEQLLRKALEGENG